MNPQFPASIAPNLPVSFIETWPSPAVSVLTWHFAVTSLTAILAPHCAGNLYFYLWRTACLFFSLFCLSLPPSPLSSRYLIHKMLFLSLTSALSNCYKTGTYRIDATGGQTLNRERVSVVCCRKVAAFVYQIKISVWKSEATVTKFCPSVCYSVVL